jgi:WD40 repeat protein
VRDEGNDETGETLAAPSGSARPSPLAHGTTPGHEATIDARLVPAGQVTRASSPSLSQVAGKVVDAELPVVDPANYQIIRELARGGMGRILEARDLRLGRPIAIKEVLHGDDIARARFDREVRITARLQHPAIVHVTEAGQWPTGQPFFAMKLIRGKPLDVRIGAAKDLAERLALLPAVTAVVDALAYAHSQSVIHRDLKPANVLVGDFGETVVIDWGIAKNLADHEEIVSLVPRVSRTNLDETMEGSVIGTPSYMPPEQAAGERVDARADVYALGALLYQLLAGVPPFVGRTTAEVLGKVMEEAPPSLARVVPDAPADLIAIVEKAMERVPAQRFPTANEMVAELKRFQQGKLVASHDYSAWELVMRWVRRNRAAVAVGAVAIITVAVLGVVGISTIIDARRDADVKATQAQARLDGKMISDARFSLATDPTESLAILKQLTPGTAELRSARLIASDAAMQGVAHVLRGHGAIEHLAISRDGRWVVSYESPGNTVRLWDLTTWTGRPLGGAPELIGLTVVPDAVLAVDFRGRIWRWNTSAAMPSPPTLVREIAGKFDKATFSPDGQRVVLEGIDDFEKRDDLMRLVDLGTETRILGPYRSAVWDPDGRSILVYERWKHEIYRITLATGTLTVIGDHIHFPNFASDGKRVWLASDSSSLRSLSTLRDLIGGQRVQLEIPLVMVAALPDGRVVGSTSRQRLRLQAETLRGQHKGLAVPFHPNDLTSGEHSLLISDGWPGSISRLKGHATPILSLATSSEGTIASGDSEGSIRIWKVPPIARDHGDGHTTATHALLANQATELVVTRRGPGLEVRDVTSGKTRRISITDLPPGYVRETNMHTERNTPIGNRFIRETISGPDHEIVELSRSPDGRFIATVDSGNHAVLWDLARNTGTLIADDIVHVAVDLDGSRVAMSRMAAGTDLRELVVWTVATKQITKLGDMSPTVMLFGSDDRLAVATTQAGVYVFQRGKVRALEIPLAQNFRCLAFSADGTKLYAGNDSWIIEEIDLVSQGGHRMLRGHMGTVVGLVIDPNGERLFSTAADNTVRVWKLADGSSTVLRGHTGLVTSIELGKDDTLVTAADDHTARIWDLQSGLSRALAGHEDRAVFAGQVANGQRIIVVDRFRQIAEYGDNLPSDHHLFRAWLDMATNLTK